MSFQYFINGNVDRTWIPQANRQVKVFPSGLVMIQQDFIYPANVSENTAFNVGDLLDDGTPCMDQAYVFPGSSLQQMGNGFTKTTVTAYGRQNTEGIAEYGWINIADARFPIAQNFFLLISYLAQTCRVSKVIPVNEVATLPDGPTLKYKITSGGVGNVRSTRTNLIRVDCKNYGNFVEMVYSYQLEITDYTE